MEKFLIAGGSGLVGSAIVRILQGEGTDFTVLTTNRKLALSQANYAYWNPAKGEISPELFYAHTRVINLAGAGIMNRRWTAEYKKEILDSRVNSGRLLIDKINSLNNNSIKTYTYASAIGYYNDTIPDVKLEDSPAGTGFVSTVCRRWESEVGHLRNTPSTILRTGIVLSSLGGVLAPALISARFGLAVLAGRGTQRIPWIHIDDLANMYLHFARTAIESQIYNAVGLQMDDTNRSLLARLGETLKKPASIWLPVPRWVFRLALGERAELIFSDMRVSAAKVRKAGFQHQFTTLEHALADIIDRKV